MAMLITHPDYMCFDGNRIERDEAPVALYEEFLTYVREKYRDRYWAALPRDVNKFYRASMPAGARNTRKRVCIITRSQYESNGRVRRYAESLACRGDLVDVIALRQPGRDPVRELKRVNVYGMIQDRADGRTGIWSYARQLLGFLFSSFVFVSRRHSNTGYDLIHVQNAPDFLVFAALYPKWTGSKVILDIHDPQPEVFNGNVKSRPESGFIARIRNVVQRLSTAFSDHVIVPDQRRRARLVAQSISEEKCSAFENSVDPEIFMRRFRTRNDETVILLFIGPSLANQGLDVAIRAMARLKDRLPNCELHLYGGGGSRDSQKDLERVASESGVAGRVLFFGGVPLDQIPQLMANADIGVVPKRADTFGNEAYSTKIMEFMSQGIPVVASRTAIDTYYFTDETVCFFKSGDDRAMAEALLKVITDPDLRQRLSKNGLDYATLNSWRSKKAEYLSLVDSLCTEKFPSADAAEGDQKVPLETRVL
jgi:glycosyltransferase involved in cell wall biosynthesis